MWLQGLRQKLLPQLDPGEKRRHKSDLRFFEKEGKPPTNASLESKPILYNKGFVNASSDG